MKSPTCALTCLLVVSLGACDQTQSPATPVEAATGGGSLAAAEAGEPEGPGGRLVYSGAIDREISDLSWTVTESSPPAGVSLSGFDMMLYGRAAGRFKNVLGFTGIPWDPPVGEALPVGREPGSGTVAAYFVADALDRSGNKWVATGGTLTITDYGETISGEFDVELAQEPDGEQTLSARGRFSDIAAIHPR